MNILGILAQPSAPPVVATSYESIQTVTVGGGGQATISFTSIPATFTHLQIRASYIDNNLGITDALWTINSDTTSGNYYGFHQVIGDGSTPSAQAYNGFGRLAVTPSGSNATSFSAAVVDILDYSNTNKYKTFRSLIGFDANGSGVVRLRSGLWMSTSAITTISISPNTGSYSLYTQFALYGIKGA